MLSENVKKKIRDMSLEFAKKLPHRLEGVLTEGENFLQSHDIEDLEEFQLLIHKLAGSAATFGFESVTIAAKTIESTLIFLLESGDELSKRQEESIREQLANLKDITRKEIRPESAAADKSSKGGENLLKEKEGGKTVYIVTGKRDDYGDLQKHLSFFGYTFEYPEDPLAFLRQPCDEEAANSIFLDCDWLSLDPDNERYAKRFKRNHPNCTVLAISHRDDFETRLKAVRAGADAFYPLPMDMSRLIDRLDGIMSGIVDQPYHVLIVDDDPEQVSYYALVLQQAGMITSVALDPKQVIKILVEAKPEIILMDIYMPGCSGIELAAIIRQQTAFVSIPIVFLSIETDIEKRLEAMKQGADDFLTKPIHSEHLIASITHRVERTRAVRFFVERDSLTGLLNHNNLMEQLNREITRSTRTGGEICFVMLDLDNFKKVNDTYGHLTGDRVLKGLARVLQERLRSTDIIGRYGGEEFGIIFPNTSPENGNDLMNELREDFGRTPQYREGTEFYVTFSCGIAAYPDFEKVVTLSEAADRALYRAKEEGKNRVVLANS